MSTKIATRVAYGNTLKKLGDINPNVVVLDADLSKSTMTAVFAAEHPDRFIQMGIAEQNMMGVAAGLSTAGKIPFASTFAMFAAGRAFEIVRNSICYPKFNVKICATHAGVTVGPDGASHQAVEDIALMRSIPNMMVINPADAVSAEKLLMKVADYNGPAYVRLGRAAVSVVYDENVELELGKGVELKQGNDVAIIATGIMIEQAIIAQEELAKEGINARVIDIHTIKPLDEEIILKAAKETKGIVTAEEHSIIGGLGGAVAEVVSENHPAIVKKVGVMDTFGESGSPAELMEKYGLMASDIIKAVKGIV